MTERYKIKTDGLRIRRKPSLIPSTIVGKLWAGDIVEVDGAQSAYGYTWRHLADGRGWFAERGWGRVFAEPVDESGETIVWDTRSVVIDASFWQHSCEQKFWCSGLARVKARGLIHHATGLDGYPDAFAHDRIATARQMGLEIVGGYMWVDVTVSNAKRVVETAVDVIHPTKGDILAMDVEKDPGNEDGRRILRSILAAFGERVLEAADRYEVVPVLYSAAGLWNGIYAGMEEMPEWLRDPRWRWWVAAPGKDGAPAKRFAMHAVPKWWDLERLWLWQFSWQGRVAGCNHNVDFSRVRKK